MVGFLNELFHRQPSISILKYLQVFYYIVVALFCTHSVHGTPVFHDTKRKLKLVLKMQSSMEALATGDFLRLLYFTSSATCCNQTCIIQRALIKKWLSCRVSYTE